jgi:hypothetical protein
MTFQMYPMAVYSPEGQMFIVEDDEERAALVAQWEVVPELGDEAGPSELGETVKRGPGRPKKNP